MFYVLKHQATGQIFARSMVNKYDLPYYGIQFWEEEEQALQEKDELLRVLGEADPAAWGVITMDEDRMKMGNVKLKNNPAYQLIEQDGFLQAIKAQS